MSDELKIPEHMLLHWKETERAWLQISATGTFKEVEAAKAEHDKAAHFVMSVAHTGMMEEARQYAQEQIDTQRTLNNEHH